MKWYDVLDPGDVFGNKTSENVSTANNALDKATEANEAADESNRKALSAYLTAVNDAYGNQASKYDSAYDTLANTEVYNPGEFTFDKTENDYFDKYFNQRTKSATNAITNSTANAGNMFSSDYVNKVAAKQQALATEAWDNALDKYNQARQTALNEYQANANTQNQYYTNLYNKNKDLLNEASTAKDNLMNAQGTYTSNLISQNNTNAQNAANIATAQANNNIAGNTSLLGRVFG